MLLPDSILIEETIDKYGYDPKLFKGLKDYSKYVVRTCFDCGNIYDQQFMSVIVSLRKNKKCKYCSNKEKSTSSADRRSLSLKEKYKSGSISHPMLNRKHTDESKMKMGRDRKGKNLESIYGKSRADEIKLKISRSVSGEKNPFYGKKHSQETIEIIRENTRKNTKRGKNSNFYGKNYNNILSNDTFFKKCNDVHGDRYDYSETEYKGLSQYINIICKKHGKFRQKAFIHIDGSGCQKCNTSKGELKILSFLLENNIPFVHQFKFNECVKITQLPFDFFLPDFNVCIEYDGEFHYLDLGFNDLKSTQENDQIKTDFCIKNGIDLIRISYLDKDNIDSILSKKFIQ